LVEILTDIRSTLIQWKYRLTTRGDFDEVARFASDRTWYSADEFILRYVAEAATRLADDHHGVPMSFTEGEGITDIADACYTYSLRTLAQMAREAVDDDLYDTSMYTDVMDAIGEAVVLGMLWD
jgi:hypothetical protein